MSIGVFPKKSQGLRSPPYALDLDSILVYISRVADEVGGHRLPYTKMRLLAAIGHAVRSCRAGESASPSTYPAPLDEPLPPSRPHSDADFPFRVEEDLTRAIGDIVEGQPNSVVPPSVDETLVAIRETCSARAVSTTAVDDRCAHSRSHLLWRRISSESGEACGRNISSRQSMTTASYPRPTQRSSGVLGSGSGTHEATSNRSMAPGGRPGSLPDLPEPCGRRRSACAR